MKGTILDHIIRAHASVDHISPDDVVPISIDTIIIPDNSAKPVFEFLEKEYLHPSHKQVYLALTHFHYQFEPRYGINQRQIIDLAKKYQFKILDNYRGLWNTQLWEQGVIGASSTVLARDSTVNYFAPLNNLNISSGIHDMIYAMMTGKYDLSVPDIIRVELTGLMSAYVTGKDIALYLKKELSSLVIHRPYMLEFSGPVLDEMTDQDLFSLSLHHYTMNRSAFIFPPLKQFFGKNSGVSPSPDAEYSRVFPFDLSNLTPLVDIDGRIEEVAEVAGKVIDSVYIGGHIGGSLDDFKIMARLFEGKRVTVPTYVVPASAKVLYEATKKGYLEPILASNCILKTPTTGICSAINDIIPLAGETILSTGYNDLSIQIKQMIPAFYNASIYTCVASAIRGYLAPIDEVIGL
jgi:3-isopropylmalate/(R)-2-methylmalate dehydratase large subunit